jgi:hypothetical protein
MPQAQLPFFSEGVTPITADMAFKKENGTLTYFNFSMPIFMHGENEVETFRMITSQFCVNGNATQAEISRAFGVTLISVKRSVKLYRKKGPRGFYEPRKTRGVTVLTESILQDAQRLLDAGVSSSEIAKRLGLKSNTLNKAIHAGRLHSPSKGYFSQTLPTHKSTRSEQDNLAVLGVGATNLMDRLSACFGELQSVAPHFQTVVDVPFGGVLLALPALLVCGLTFEIEKHFQLPKGYYGLQSILLLLAFMALARIKTIEDLRYCAPGEWGKLIGLDRIPEVRTLREKVKHLSLQGQSKLWSAQLCRLWMETDIQAAGVVYIDGHVRVYHGSQTSLPKHYVAREKLCLRATVDYWVNAMDGQPFFYINKAVDPGLLGVLENEIVPRLEKEIPAQPCQELLEGHSLLHRFTLIFDREGYSPDFIRRMKEKHIACITYHKYPKEDWAEQEFSFFDIHTIAGNVVRTRLAERGTLLSSKLWVREIRKLSETGQQISILSTDYQADLTVVAGQMADRWSQENFFKYMREHYNLDRLIDYSLESIPDTIKIVNPEYRRLEGEIRRLSALCARRLAEFGAIHLEGEIEPHRVENYQQKQASLQEEIERLQQENKVLKERRKAVDHHISINQLPESERFRQLATPTKHFLDTIKMIAYRAETAMLTIAREKMSRQDDGRGLLRAIYQTEVNLVPDQKNKTLTVQLHHLANHCSNKILHHLCDEMNATNTIFPGTELKLIYKLGSS